MIAIAATANAKPAYVWLQGPAVSSLRQRVAVPEGYDRVSIADSSFAAWLRELPVKVGQPKVLLFDGSAKKNQSAHQLIIDIDVGRRDLQQCADAVMRLRAEYLFAAGRADQVCFRFTSGDKHPWAQWRRGLRPRVKGNQVSFRQSKSADDSHGSFRAYLQSVFMWAGSASLSRELRPVKDPAKLRAGDVFIQGGFPGHAVLVADVAENQQGQRVFLLLQSYMPAQNIHLLKNPGAAISPWYAAQKTGTLVTPEWTFQYSNLKRFTERGCPKPL